TMALGDVIHLRDGTRLEGTIQRTEEGYGIELADGRVLTVEARQVLRVEFQRNTPSGPAAAAEAAHRFKSLRTSLESTTDPASAIQRLEQFGTQYKEAGIEADLQAELAIWRSRQERGLVKQGEQWVTPEQQAALLHEAVAKAAEARQ